MYPILFSFGPVTLYYLSLLVLVSLITFSFLFWRSLKDQGIDDDRIFTTTFYAIFSGFIFSRIVYVIFHWSSFSATPLTVFVPWVAPGFSFYGLVTGMSLVFAVSVKTMKLPARHLFDAVIFATPFAHAFGALGALLDGSLVGRITDVPWAVVYLGYEKGRHPSGLYLLAVDILAAFCYLLVRRLGRARPRQSPLLPAITALLILSGGYFLVEFSAEQELYWAQLTVNQWLLLAIFSEATGALFITGGGKDAVFKFSQRFRSVSARVLVRLYATFRRS